MNELELTFPSEGALLQGTLSVPSSDPFPVVVAAHGAQAGHRDYFLYRHLTHLLAGHGIGTFRFDRRGEGASTGEVDAPFSQLARDVGNAVTAVGRLPQVDATRIGLWGVSQGGWLVVLSAADKGAVAGLMIVSGTPVTPAQQMNHAVKQLLIRRGYGEEVVKEALDLRAAVEAFAIGKLPRERVEPRVDRARRASWFEHAWIPELDGLEWGEMDLDIGPMIPRLRVPTLLLFGEQDPWIPVEESIAVWKKRAASSLDLRIEVIPGVGHEMVAGDPLAILDRGQPVPAYEQVVTDWVARVLGPGSYSR
jgi:uncharacterized protein